MFEVDMRLAQIVTLAHMFALGAEDCTAHDIYKLYMDLPILVHRHQREARSWREGWGESSAVQGKRGRTK